MSQNKTDQVIVRGMTKEWFLDHFKDMAVYFGGDRRAIPKYDSDFIGFYLEAPDSAITHIGIVDRVDRDAKEATFHLKAVIKLDNPVKVTHGIRKHEYWKLSKLGINKIGLIANDFFKIGGTK